MKRILLLLAALAPSSAPLGAANPFDAPPTQSVASPTGSSSLKTKLRTEPPGYSRSGPPAAPADPFTASGAAEVQSYPVLKQTFNVGKVGVKGAVETRETLLLIFAEFQRDYLFDGQGVVLKPSIARCEVISATILQRLSAREFLFKDFYLKTNTDRNWVDKDAVTIFAVPAAPYSYGAVSGAKRSVKGYVEAGAEEGATQQQFLDALKAGKKFLVHVLETRKHYSGAIGGQDFMETVDVAYTIAW